MCAEVLVMDGEDWPDPTLSQQWRSLIGELWCSDGTSIVGFLPRIVATIKKTRSAAMAERGLLAVLESPKVKFDELELEGPARVTPGYLAEELFADAAGLPPGKLRTNAIAKINAISREWPLTPSQIVAALERLPKETIKKRDKEASAQKAKRARRQLGISRKSGRPRKPDKK